MSVATGFFRRIGVNGSAKFMATFDINSFHYTLGGMMVSSMPHFSCGHVNLTYTSLSQLTSIRLVEGNIGPNGLVLRLTNGPIIEGTLEWQLDPPSIELIGCGIWFQT
ncbi:hypothetical protein CPB84DRAFT_765438 [Gymnopilus junonius]|uniref:Uncharacterized protein n=1 Tax=Gymnopilus junonius TaxID=109634 RepID=A0A9P5TU99_GYMJU|nr:hypothetical protein CPB84DRAFT_765438 [Gymnopilus junonius]